MDLPGGVKGNTVMTGRLRMRYIESGPAEGIPVVMIHGNLSTGRFYEHLMPRALRRFGRWDRQPAISRFCRHSRVSRTCQTRRNRQLRASL